MPYDPLSRITLTKTVKEMKPPKTFFRTRYFRGGRNLAGKLAEFKIKEGKRRMAPMTKRNQKGVLVERLPYTVKLVETPYSRQKMVCSADDLFVRNLGETMYPDDPGLRREIEELTVSDLMEMNEMLTRREEWMCAQLLQTGSFTLSQTSESIDFTLNSDQVKDESVTAPWSDSNVDPIAKLRLWKRILQQNSGLGRIDCIMGANAYDEFIKNENVISQLDNRRIVIGSIDPIEIGGAERKGILSDPTMELWTYDEYFIDDQTETEGEMMDPDTVILVSRDIDNDFYYGRIAHCGGPGRARRWSHLWIDPDTGERYLNLESSPCGGLTQPNGVFKAKVLPSS